MTARRGISVVLVAAFAVALTAPAHAEAYDATGASVARVSVIRGNVTLQHGENGTPSPAAMNLPVLAGDYVSTAGDARAEIELDATSALRLGAGVQLRFTRLDATNRELQLAEGTIDLRLLRDDAAPAQIDTPSIAIRPTAAGSYRVTVDAVGRTQVTVRSGRADAIATHETRVLLPGTTVSAEGAAADPTLRTGSAIALDEFDRFNTERDGAELRGLADTNAPPGVAGIGDLTAYGHWISDATYGTVWTPYAVAPGWAPYRDGAWSWYAPYGWTWIGSEPWGWAPYHYGRWYHHPHHGWCWVPARGAVAWSPALVTFVGFAPRFGTIGWVPLAPFQPFTPWWGTSTFLVTEVRSAGPNAPYGMTAISKQRFLEGRFRDRVAVAPNRAHEVHAIAGVPVGTPALRRTIPETGSGTVWARFSPTRSAPVHAVQVIDGTNGGTPAVHQSGGVWSRFANHNAPVLPSAQTAPVRVAPVRAAPVREAPVRAQYVAPTSAQPAYAPPPAPVRYAPAVETRPIHHARTHEQSASQPTHRKP